MAVKSLSSQSINTKNIPTLGGNGIWVRNPEWITNTVLESDEKVVALLAIYPSDPNAIALSATLSSGNFNVDWGDGSSTNGTASLSNAYHVYDYASISQTPTSGGYKQVLITITPTVAGALQYVNFQLKHTSITATNPSVNYLEIKCAGPNFKRPETLGSVTDGSLGVVIMPFLENVEILNCTAGHMNAIFNGVYSLQRVYIKSTTNMDGTEQWTSLFYNCSSLLEFTYITPNNIIAPRTLAKTFYNCRSLKIIPDIKFINATSFGDCFFYCFKIDSLKEVTFNSLTSHQTGTPLMTFMPIKSLKVTNNTQYNVYITATSYALESYELVFNGSAGVCGYIRVRADNARQAILNINAASTNLSWACNNNNSMTSVKITGSGIVTTCDNVFQNCTSITSIPWFDTTGCTSFSNTFYGCWNLKSLPALNYASSINTSSTWQLCYSLTSIAYSHAGTIANSSNTNGFDNCWALQEIPPFHMQSLGITANSKPSLIRIRSFGTKANSNIAGAKLSKTALEEYFENLGTGAGGFTNTITGNPGADTAVSLSGTTTAGSNIVSMANTTGLSVGMQITGTGISTARSISFTDAGDIVTLVGHGIANGDKVSFSAITTTTGISIYTPYYIVNSTADTFQLSLTNGGSPITLTNNGTGTMLYMTTITAITPNTNITLSIPASSSATNTLASRLLKTQLSVMRGMSVVG